MVNCSCSFSLEFSTHPGTNNIHFLHKDVATGGVWGGVTPPNNLISGKVGQINKMLVKQKFL